MDATALYVMGATAETTGRVSLGRYCYPMNVRNNVRDMLWAYPLLETDVRVSVEASSEPQQILHVGNADPAQPVALCQFVLETQNGVATIDNVFLAKLDIR